MDQGGPAPKLQPKPIGHQVGYPHLVRYAKGTAPPVAGKVVAKRKRAIVDYLDEELAEMAVKSGLERHEAGRLLAKKWLEHIFKHNDKALLIEALMRRDGAVAVKVKQEIDVVQARLSEMFTAIVGPAADAAVGTELERRKELQDRGGEPEGEPGPEEPGMEAGPRDVEVEEK